MSSFSSDRKYDKRKHVVVKRRGVKTYCCEGKKSEDMIKDIIRDDMDISRDDMDISRDDML